MCISDDNREILTIELLTSSKKNIFVSCCYKPLEGNWKNHATMEILANATNENKLYFATEDFKQSG